MRPAETEVPVLRRQLIWEQQRCLRRRLRGFACRKCIAACFHGALVETGKGIVYDQDQCTGCGRCVVACPNDAFDFAGSDWRLELEERLHRPELVISCHRCDHSAINEVRIPCVGVISAELLVYLGLRRQEGTLFNLSGCADCVNRLCQEVFLNQLRRVRETTGHLFRGQLQAAQSPRTLPGPGAADRRNFLQSLGETVADIVKGKLGIDRLQQAQKATGRRIPARVQWLLQALPEAEGERTEIINACAPGVTVSGDCTLCPRCTGMCPTGALKLKKNNGEKVLAYNRRLCSACGLCAAFCRDGAVTLQEAAIRCGRTTAAT